MVEIQASEEIIIALAHLLYRFIPNDLNNAFQISTKEELEKIEVKGEFLDKVAKPLLSVNGLILNMIKTVKSKINNQNIQLNWRFSALAVHVTTRKLIRKFKIFMRN